MALPERTQGWESIWSDVGALSGYWRTPEPSVLAWAALLWRCGGRRVLDLGCGIGRHTVALARLGFAVTATDVSTSGLATCAAWLAGEGLEARTVCHQMQRLPFSTCAFDGVIAYNVIYHATVAGMRETLAEIRRVLRPGGRFYVTVISREDGKVAEYQPGMRAGRCREVEPFTFIYPRDAPDDKFLPHHYCDEAEVRDLLGSFVVDDLCLDRRSYAGEAGTVQVGVHYHIQAQRP